MKITRAELVVEIDDAKFYFDEPGERAFLTVIELEKAANLADKINLMFSHLRRIENVDDVQSPEELRELDLPASLVVELLHGFVTAMYSKMSAKKSTGAEEKNGLGS